MKKTKSEHQVANGVEESGIDVRMGIGQAKLSRRGIMKGAAFVGAAAVTSGFPAIHSRAQSTGSVKFGLLEPLSGTFALYGVQKHHGTQLALKEINEGYTLLSGPCGPGGSGANNVYDDVDEILVESGDKGILGRQVDLIAPDPQSDNRMIQQLSRRLILDDEVDVLMGAGASAEREAIRPIMDEAKQLYFYNNQYEGGVADKYAFCTGAVPEQQIIPVMAYMVSKFGKRIYIMAADYNFGQLSAMWTRSFAGVIGAEIVGEEFIPLSVSDFTSTISRIQKVKPDWVMTYISGQNHANYYPQSNAAGARVPMGSSLNLAQSYEHKRFAAPALAGMHVAVNYMEEIPTARNQAFVKRWRAMFPDEPYIGQEGQMAYVATHLYAIAARLAKSTQKEAVIEALESGIGLEAPEGWIFMDPATHHMSHYIRTARCEEDHSISFIQEWPSIDPWWTRRLGVNLVRNPEFKQYTPEDDSYFNKK